MANGRGGRRPGAGRKKGGTNKRHSREIVLDAMERGRTPLQYMLRVMKNPRQPSARRDKMAELAAPYCHPRLQATTVRTPGSQDDDKITVVIREFCAEDGTELVRYEGRRAVHYKDGRTLDDKPPQIEHTKKRCGVAILGEV